jgi:hypothetical protein
MPEWTREELTQIGSAEELKLASMRRDRTLRKPVTMWVVREDDRLYVRSVNGPTGAWFRGTQTCRQGHIRAGGVDKDVSFVFDTDDDVNDQIDAAYTTNTAATLRASSTVSLRLRHVRPRSNWCLFQHPDRGSYEAPLQPLLRQSFYGEMTG